MKYTFLLSILLFSSIQILAQLTGQKPGLKTPFNQRPEICQLTGTVIDESNDKSLEFATVAVLYAGNDSLMNGGLSDKKGKFAIDKLRPGRYKIKIDFIGYESKIIDNVMLKPKQGECAIDLGKIPVSTGNLNLNEIEVTAERNFLQNNLDRKSYRIEKLATADGSSATEILKNIPSVEVDIDDNISLRGNQNVTVLIDGKPSSLTGAGRSAILDQIPANSIESIEVITNPSAKFDPDGMSGIINVVLKKNALQGLNGSVTVGAGTGNKYNGSLNLGYRTKKINLYTNYGYNYRERWGKGNSDNELTNDPENIFQNQNSNSTRRKESHLIKGGADFYLSQKSIFGLSATVNTSEGDDDGNERTVEKIGTELSRDFNRIEAEIEEDQSIDINAFFEQKFKKKKQELIISANHSRSKGDEKNEYTQIYNVFDTQTLFENFYTNTKNQVSTIQTDYTHPITETSGLELGYKSIFRTIENDFQAELFDHEQQKFNPNTLLNNRYEYNEGIHAVYGLYTHSIGKYSIKAGLRAEQALTEFQPKDNPSDSIYTNNYFSIFPSVFLTRDLGDRKKIQLSYTKRINRPRTRQLNPFINYSDPTSLRKGNPRLNPEYIDAVELGYEQKIKAFNISTSIYYRYVDNMMRRVINQINATTTELTFNNFDNSQSYGIETVINGQLFDKWRNNFSFNLFRTITNGENLEENLNADALGWNLKYIGNIALWQGADFQVMVFYNSPRDIPNGRIKQFVWSDLGFKQKFWKNKASLSLSIQDIFDTRQFSIDVIRPTIIKSFTRKRESRIANLTFTYRFGKQDFSKRKKNRGNRQGGGGFEDAGF